MQQRVMTHVPYHDVGWPDCFTQEAAKDCVLKQHEYLEDLMLGMHREQPTLQPGVHFGIDQGKLGAHLWVAG